MRVSLCVCKLGTSVFLWAAVPMCVYTCLHPSLCFSLWVHIYEQVCKCMCECVLMWAYVCWYKYTSVYVWVLHTCVNMCFLYVQVCKCVLCMLIHVCAQGMNVCDMKRVTWECVEVCVWGNMYTGMWEHEHLWELCILDCVRAWAYMQWACINLVLWRFTWGCLWHAKVTLWSQVCPWNRGGYSSPEAKSCEVEFLSFDSFACLSKNEKAKDRVTMTEGSIDLFGNYAFQRNNLNHLMLLDWWPNVTMALANNCLLL